MLSYAIRVCTEDAIRVLLDAGADIDAEHGAPLKYAISAHRLSVVRLLLERGARTNFGISILRFAKHRGSEETVELLIQYGAEDLEEEHPDFVHSDEEELKELGSDDTDWETVGSDTS